MFDQYEKEIIRWCENLKDKLLDKYLKGKLDHGGEPVSIDCSKELAEELKDIINYHCIDLVNERIK